jgi:hypothetical protein
VIGGVDCLQPAGRYPAANLQASTSRPVSTSATPTTSASALAISATILTTLTITILTIHELGLWLVLQLLLQVACLYAALLPLAPSLRNSGYSSDLAQHLTHRPCSPNPASPLPLSLLPQPASTYDRGRAYLSGRLRSMTPKTAGEGAVCRNAEAVSGWPPLSGPCRATHLPGGI